MDEYSGYDTHSFNGGANGDDRGKRRNYKLMVDPMLKMGPQKLYRFDGHNPGDPMPVIPRDPRSRMKRFWTKREAVHLPVPKFKYDQYYVGTILPKEVTFTNLNDNIQQQFLRDMCSRYGNVEDCKIFYHPVTKKHLGIAKVLFTSTRAARNCVNNLDNTSKMGNIMTVFLDSMGKERQRLLDELTGEVNKPQKMASPPRQKPRHHHHREKHSQREKPPEPPPQPPTIPLNQDFPPQPSPAQSQPPPPQHFRDFPPRPPLPSGEWTDPGFPPQPDFGPRTPNPQNMLPGFRPPSEAFNPHVPPPGLPPPPMPPQPPPQPPAFNEDKHRRGSRHTSDHSESSHRKERHREYHRSNRHAYEDEEVNEDDSDDYRRSFSRSHYDRSRSDKYYDHNDEDDDEDSRRSWDRHSRHRRHKKKSRHRHRHRRYDEDEEPISNLRDDDYETVSDNSNFAADDTSQAKSQSPEQEKKQSLESRIQSLLRNTDISGPPGPDDESANLEPPVPAPPLPMEDAPPLPPDQGPPLPPAEDAPPLPPEPAPDDAFCSINAMSSPWLLPPVPQNGEDDRMSLSSLSSGEEQNAVIQMNVPQEHVSNSHFMYNAHNFQNNVMSSGLQNLAKEKLIIQQQLAQSMRQQEEEKTFMKILDRITSELKHIMRKDLQRKMVETSAFNSFEVWWDYEDNMEKKLQASIVLPSPPAMASPVKPPLALMNNNSPLPNTASSEPTEKKEAKDMSHTLAALFDQNEGSMGGFGMGGLLGIRGGIPKLPSFRRPKFRPPTPPPVEEDEEEDRKEEEDSQSFKGPRTPEESENEESSEESDFEPSKARKKEALYSDDSGSDEDESSESSVSSSEEESDLESDMSDENVSVSSASSVPETIKPKRQERSKPIYTSSESEEEKEASEEEKEQEVAENKAEVPSLDTSESEIVDVDKTPDKSEESSDEREIEAKVEELGKKEEVGKEERKVEDMEVEKPEEKEDKKSAEEEAAALALLEMQHQKPKEPEVVEKPAKPERPPQTPAQIAMAAEHNYFAPMRDSPKKEDGLTESKQSDSTDSASEGEGTLVATLPSEISIDHSYCQPFYPTEDPQAELVPAANIGVVAAEVEIKEDKPKKAPKRPRGGRKLTDVTNVPRELLGLLPPAVDKKPVPQFKPRTLDGEMQVTYEFLFKGIDVEDVDFIKRRYEELLGDDSPQTYWLNDTHWVDHSHTRIPDPVPPKKRKKYSQQDEVVVAHKTGCARTEGYYKISHQEKHGYLKDFRGVQKTKEEEAKEKDARDAAAKKKVQISREARSESRRWQNVLQSMGEDCGDLLKFNQLKFRKKNLKFAKSGIHDWGLFALEPIAEGEMVIEYVGAVVRQSMADMREKKYEAMGIGSSYLFRIDQHTIIDATKCGNLARFINHSCNPNCVAKIITVESHKKIVIYSRRDIGVNEEITYDYKFPLEDEKIPCLCGTSTCRGTLN